MVSARLRAGSAALVVIALLSACGEGGINLPTSLPTGLPSVTRPGGEPTESTPPAETTTPTETTSPSETPSPSESTTPPETTTPSETVTPTQTTTPPDVTESPDQTEEPAATEPAPEGEDTADAGGADDAAPGTSTWWIWLLAVAALVAIVAAFVPARRRRRRWVEETAALTAELGRLDTEIVPDVLTRASTTEAGVAWQASGAWRFDLDRRLRAQSESAPDPARRSYVEDCRDALGALVTAVDAEISTPASAGADELRARRAAVEQARAQLRAALQPPPG